MSQYSDFLKSEALKSRRHKGLGAASPGSMEHQRLIFSQMVLGLKP